MPGISEEQLLGSLFAIGIILLVGRGTAECARRLGQPEVLGELIGGFVLGPSAVGAIAPGFYHRLFIDSGVGVPLSMLSWLGAILLLLIAGLEADLSILRSKIRSGVLTAVLAITVSLVAGTYFSALVLHERGSRGYFLGIVLSVTAVSVIAKILIERDTLRRGYGQVILAAGVASEVVVWLLVSVAAALPRGNPVSAGLLSAFYSIIFFAVMMTLGRRLTFWAMRRIADSTHLVNGQLSLVIVLAAVCAAITQLLGLHALLGAFVAGVILGRAPRATLRLKESVQTLTVSLFAPIFFVLAGMRVDIFQLGGGRAIGSVVLLLAIASSAKIGAGMLGARLGGIRGWEALIVGLGVNLKGGTDVIVAILGTEIGIFSQSSYTLYTVAAILTVLITPPILSVLEKRVPPSREELERLEREEAKRRAYLSEVERVLVPMSAELLPGVAAIVVGDLARAKHAMGEIFDLTEILPPETATEGAATTAGVGVTDTATSKPSPVPDNGVASADALLTELAKIGDIEINLRRASGNDVAQAVLEATEGHNLVAFGSPPPQATPVLSFGALQDRIVGQGSADVMIVINRKPAPPRPERLPLSRRRHRRTRILAPVNGLEHSMAAADVAAHLAKVRNCTLVLFTGIHSRFDTMFWQEREHRDLLDSGYRILREAKFRMQRLDVRFEERVELTEDPAQAILNELKQRRRYDLLVVGAAGRAADGTLSLGSTVERVLVGADVPAILLVSRAQPAEFKTPNAE